MKISAQKSITSITLADLHRSFIAECCAQGQTTIMGLYASYDTYRNVPGKRLASLYEFMLERYSDLAEKYNTLSPEGKLNRSSMKVYMLEMRKKEEEVEKSDPSVVQEGVMAGKDDVSVLTFDTNLNRDGIATMDVDSVKSGCSGMNSVMKGVRNMGFLEDKSMDGDQSMHTAHSERHYISLSTPARVCSRIDELASRDVASSIVDKVVHSLKQKDGGTNEVGDFIKVMTAKERVTSIAELKALMKSCQKVLQLLEKTEATADGDEEADDMSCSRTV
jgi:hypothetical protein